MYRDVHLGCKKLWSRIGGGLVESIIGLLIAFDVPAYGTKFIAFLCKTAGSIVIRTIRGR